MKLIGIQKVRLDEMITYFMLSKPERAEGLMKLVCSKCHKVYYVKSVRACECVK